MGKYYINNKKKKTNKNTTSDVTPLTHGVHTRARTLALRSSDSSFLQLRSRLLEKKVHTPAAKHPKSQLQPKTNTENHSRSTRESTPCNAITAAGNISTPGSTTKQMSPTGNAQNDVREREIEEFFSREERSQQQLFIQKYNFDIVNDKPLPGRYEWVKVTP